MEQLLKDQVALITGGNAGIGKAIAFEFAQRGAKLAIFGTNAEKNKSVVDEIKVLCPHITIESYQVNVSKTSEVEQAIQEVLKAFGTVDILVNNAGVTCDQLLMKMSEDDWDTVMQVNVKSCFNTCKALVRHMMKARKGIIINMSSVVGLSGNAGQANYAASKAAIIGFTKSLAKELASRGIRANSICPGFISTAMTDALNDTQKESILNEIPMGRMGIPQEVAQVALFLACSLSNYVTGQTFVVDGGMTM